MGVLGVSTEWRVYPLVLLTWSVDSILIESICLSHGSCANSRQIITVVINKCCMSNTEQMQLQHCLHNYPTRCICILFLKKDWAQTHIRSYNVLSSSNWPDYVSLNLWVEVLSRRTYKLNPLCSLSAAGGKLFRINCTAYSALFI